MAPNAAFAPPELPRKGIFCSSAYIFRQDGSRSRVQQQKGRSVAEPAWLIVAEAREFARRRENGPVNRFQREGGEADFASPYSPRLGGLPAAAKRQVRCRTCLVNSGGGAENRTAYALHASAGLARIRSRRPCSTKRAIGTFRDPRNASGARFPVTARSSKKAGPLPNLPDKLWWRRGESNSGPY